MSSKVSLLDCTLRDGGYINNWCFGHDNIVNIFNRVVNSGTEMIEIGFLDERVDFNTDSCIMPDTESLNKIFDKFDKKNTTVVAMIDYGTCGLQNIQPCSECFLDGIRVIFKKDIMYPAMDFCRQLKELGYLVFAQLVSVSSYTDDELKEVVKLANDIKPYAISMVDTYGLLNPGKLTHILNIIDSNLDKSIALGFHAHNNFQLGYINATTVLKSGIDRHVFVDGSLYGMGKSAGNAPVELIAMYMNDEMGKNYKITEMQEAITSSILEFQKKSPWGYQLFYYIAASNQCHPNYVSFLMNKRTLSVTAINEILQRIPEEEKLSKNLKLVEQLYLDYQKNECDDSKSFNALEQELKNKKILVIGPASSVVKYEDKIKEYIDRENPVIISINYFPDRYSPDYVFFTNSGRFVQSATKMCEERNKAVKIIASSNLTKTSTEFEYVFNYSSLIDTEAEFPDNSMCMLLRILKRMNCNTVALAGLDGYNADSVNYFDTDKEYSFLRNKAESLNNYARRFFKDIKNDVNIVFVTPSRYQEEITHDC
ncbi:MAG: aldolase catalytic domain-containing protein [Eubacterium sp.]|nr:aldolase catalytic domain-containing protein [Eubacterium sp.]MBR0412739.1 aldolase catalytic domain-containing protein [Eubacterium sp.]